MDKGWIKLNRQITDHWIWQDADKFRAWIDLILMANHEQKKVMMREGLVVVRRGQLVTSIGKLASRWNWSKEKVYRFLNTLECDGMITRNSNRFKTVLTIVNYGKFQGQGNTDKTTNKSSNESSNKSSNESRTRINKNEKEIKEDSLPTSSEVDAAELDEYDGMSPDEWWEAFVRGEVHADWE